MNPQQNNQQNPKKQLPITLDMSEKFPVRDAHPPDELTLGISNPLQELFLKFFPTCYKQQEAHHG